MAVVERFSRTERTLHWTHATAFVIMLASGLCLYLPALSELVGRRWLFKDIHVYTAVAWLCALALVALLGDRRRLRATRREIEFLVEGRFNRGQMLNAVATAAFAVLFTVTGALLWLGERDTRFRFANTLLIHDWLMYVSVILFAGHLFLVIRFRHSLNGMVRGWVREDWARAHHPLWDARGDDPGGVHPPGGVVQHGGGGERGAGAGRAGAVRRAGP
jgi:formate dehydrogenase subunit gamma